MEETTARSQNDHSPYPGTKQQHHPAQDRQYPVATGAKKIKLPCMDSKQGEEILIYDSDFQ